MEDLFGDNVSTVNGRLIELERPFSNEEVDQIVDEVVHGGELIRQLAESLTRLRKLLGSSKSEQMTTARRDAWDDLMWVYDLYETPAKLPFDTACDAVGLDAEELRGAISNEFGGEIRQLVETITARLPEARQHLNSRLHRYIVLAMH